MRFRLKDINHKLSHKVKKCKILGHAHASETPKHQRMLPDQPNAPDFCRLAQVPSKVLDQVSKQRCLSRLPASSEYGSRLGSKQGSLVVCQDFYVSWFYFKRLVRQWSSFLKPMPLLSTCSKPGESHIVMRDGIDSQKKLFSDMCMLYTLCSCLLCSCSGIAKCYDQTNMTLCLSVWPVLQIWESRETTRWKNPTWTSAKRGP